VTVLEIVLAYVVLQIVMALLMAVFPRDEVMRNKTGISSFTERPKTVGEYFFNGLVVLIAGGALAMEYINKRIVKRPWWWRIGTRFIVLLGVIALIFISSVLIYIFSE